MIRIDSSCSLGAQVTVFFFCPDFVKPNVVVVEELLINGGGVNIAGDSFRVFAIDLRASWNGSNEDGCAILVTGSFFAIGAFLKLGSFGLGLGFEKNDESDLASFTEVTTGFTSFFTTVGRDVAEEATANFLAGGAALDGGGSFSFRFLFFVSVERRVNSVSIITTDERDLPSIVLTSGIFDAASGTESSCRHRRSIF